MNKILSEEMYGFSYHEVIYTQKILKIKANVATQPTMIWWTVQNQTRQIVTYVNFIKKKILLPIRDIQLTTRERELLNMVYTFNYSKIEVYINLFIFK